MVAAYVPSQVDDIQRLGALLRRPAYVPTYGDLPAHFRPISPRGMTFNEQPGETGGYAGPGSAFTAVAYRMRFDNTHPFYGLRLFFHGHHPDSSAFNWVPNPNAVTIDYLAYEAPGGTITPITYGNGTSFQTTPFVLAPSGELLTDELAVGQPTALQTAYIRIHWTVADTAHGWPLGGLNFDGGSTGNCDSVTMGGTIANASAAGALATTAAGYYLFAPASILGRTPPLASRPVVGIVGDSIASGFNDLYNANGWSGEVNPGRSQTMGWPAVSLGGSFKGRSTGFTFKKFSQPSGLQQQLAANNFAGLLPLLSGCDYVLDQYGTNDFAIGSRTFANLQADSLTCWNMFNAFGLRVVKAKIIPRTAFTATQLVYRTKYNFWLDGQVSRSGPLYAVVDPNVVAETVPASSVALAGTVSVTNGSTAVIFSQAQAVLDGKYLFAISADATANVYQLASHSDSTHYTLDTAYTGTTAAAATALVGTAGSNVFAVAADGGPPVGTGGTHPDAAGVDAIAAVMAPILSRLIL